jgi:UDP-N-acetylmuramate dehydrogenase
MRDVGDPWAVLLEELRERLPHLEIAAERPLGATTTYRVGGAARIGVEVGSETDLVVLATGLADRAVPVLVVGLGSNLLVADRGFDGVAVTLGPNFQHIDISGTTVVAGAAVALPALARRTVRAGLRGFEWAVGVPGSIGGAVRMNAGGHGSDMAETLQEVRVVDLTTGQHGTVAVSDLELGYRRSSIRPTDVVTEATIELERGDVDVAEALLTDIVRWRRENQPGGQNAGSVFTNPPGDSAGRLIDAAGLKGVRYGSAQVSTKHANFIQADPGGSADDIWSLMKRVQDRVREHSGVSLGVETRLVGFEPGTDR